MVDQNNFDIYWTRYIYFSEIKIEIEILPHFMGPRIYTASLVSCFLTLLMLTCTSGTIIS